MGCWNKTCGLSGLHITAGSGVYVFVLAENTDRTDRCYSTAFWSPLLVPFESVYDDYGGGEENTGPALPYIMDALKANIVEMEQGDNEYHDIPVKRDGFNEKLFFEAVHEHRLFVQGRQDSHRAVDFVMVRKDVVDYILENRVIKSYVGSGQGTCGYSKSYINYKFADILVDIPAFLDEIERKKCTHTILMEQLVKLQEDEEANAEKIYDLQDLMIELSVHRNLEDVFPWRHPNKVQQWLGHDTYRFFSPFNVGMTIAKMVKTGKRADAEALLVEHLKACYIHGYMESIRKNWGPGGHEGSQSAEVDEYRLLCETITAVLDADAYDDEDEEDEE
jgi:hypothetical protein